MIDDNGNDTGNGPASPMPETQTAAPATPQPTQPAQPTTGPAPTPNNVSTAPAAPAPLPQQHDYFRSILGILAGGSRKPVMGPDGKPQIDANGKVVTAPMTKANLGAGILAGALSSMMAGFQHLPERNGNGVMTSHVNEASQAGAAAGAAASSQARVNTAQQTSDIDMARKYQTMKQNLDLHSLSLAVDRQDQEAKQALVDHATPIMDGMKLAQMPDGTPMIAGQDESESELQKRIQESGGDVTRDSAIPTGVRPEVGPDGQPTGRQELLWTSFHNGGKIKVTPELREEFPEIANVADGTEMPVSAAAKLFLNKGTNTIVSNMFDDVAKKQSELTGKPVKIDWQKLKKENPAFGALQSKMLGLSGLDPDQFVAAAKQLDPRLGAVMQQALGVDADKWTAKRAGDKKAAELQEQLDKENEARKAKADSPEGRAAAEKAQLEIKKLKKETDQLEHKDDDQDVLAEQLIDPRNLTAMKDIGGRGSDRAQILAKAARLAQSRGLPFDIGVTNARIKYLGEYEDPKGRSAVNRSALNNILQHAADLSDLNEQNRRTNMQMVNTPINAIKNQFGDQAYTAYQTASGVLKDELSLYFAGGFAPSKDQQEMWNKIQADAATPAQTEAFAKEVAKLAFRRADTFNEGFKTMMGYDDPNLVTPAAKVAAQHLSPELGQIATQYGSGGKIGGNANVSQPQRAQDQLTNFQVNPSTGAQIGWSVAKKQWIDVKTGKPAQ